ncbi:MAG TPA: protein kinase [Gemmatimonadales bacterium]|nr:protein kinase [Gemmatimonadales bacterium]
MVVVAVLGGSLLITKIRADRAADESLGRALTATRAAMDDALASRSHALAQSARLIAQVPDYVARISEALRLDNRANLLDQADEFRGQLDATWALIADARGILRARTDQRDVMGDSLGEGALVGLALEGNVTQGVWIEPGPEGDEIFQAVGVPIVSPGGASLFGVLVAALRVDSAFASDLRENTGSEVVFFSLDQQGRPLFAVATLDAAALASGMGETGSWETALAQGRDVRVRWEVAGDHLVGIVGSLVTAAEIPVGGYVGLRSRDRELATFEQLRATIIQAFAAGLALAVVSSLLVAGQITRPVRRLVQATREVAEGKYDVPIDVRSSDEIGELAGAFRRMLQELKEKQELVEFLSAGGGQTVALTADQMAQVTRAGAGAGATARLAVQPGAMLEVGGVLGGRYEIRKVLGAGGMGVVYRAHDRELNETVAIKTLKPEAVAADANSLERFKQEIRLARRITHRNVVRTHDLGEVNGVYYITMEYVEGTNLKDLIRRRGHLPIGVTLTVGKQLLRALEVAHEQGVVHRDIKPQNAVVDAGGFLKVMDFGIARHTEGARLGEGLTQAGTALGTPEYMAPEQLMGEVVDPRADLYAAGAVLYECVTGRTVFVAPTLMALLAKHLEEAPEDPRVGNPDVPEGLAQVILKGLAKKRDDRWSSAGEMLRALEQIKVEEPAAA